MDFTIFFQCNHLRLVSTQENYWNGQENFSLSCVLWVGTNDFKDAVQSVCKQRLCLHFGIQHIEFYETTIYIFMILEHNKLSRHNNQALLEHKMK
jgi:hypothetical protein